MTALAPAYFRKCCCVKYGTEERDSLRTRIPENFEEFREMQIVRDAKCVGTMIGPDGHLHRLTVHRKKCIQRVLKINASSKSLVELRCDFKIYSISVLSFIGSVCAPDRATLKAENHALQCTTAGPYNAIPSTLLGVGSVCGLGPDLVGIHSVSLAARYRVPACSTTFSHGHNCTFNFRSLPCGKKNSLFPPWPSALRMLSWTVVTHSVKFRKNKAEGCHWAAS